MQILYAVLIYVGYHILNYLFAVQNSFVVEQRIKAGNKKQIEHFWYGLLYCALCAPQLWLVNIPFALAVIPLHLSIFAPCYNEKRGIDMFHLSTTSSAITDRTMVRIGLKSLFIPCAVAQIISAILVCLSLKLL